MKLSIVTINYNNVVGVQKTLQSVFVQTCHDIEHVVVDGGSNDGSRDAIKDYANKVSYSVLWVSEPDQGIYNAMNKGLRMATGEYIQILNSGDVLAGDDVVERLLSALKEKNYPEILYGNMLKDFGDGKMVRDRCFAGSNPTMIGFIHGTLNHDPAYIKRTLFDKFGYYREDLPITADWRWYVEAIPFGGVIPVYVDIDVTIFDMTGISETQLEKRESERVEELKRILPVGVYKDYMMYSFPMEQFRRIKRHPAAYKLFYFIERVLFKMEKRERRRKREQVFK